MRSSLVYSANKRLSNRFLLCRMVALAAKSMHRGTRHFAASINEGLTQIATMPSDASRLEGSDAPMRSLEAPVAAISIG